MPGPTAAATSPRGAEYILIAIANASRASAVKSLALEYSPTVVLVRDGQEAIQHMDRAGAPRLLITSLSLPRADGFAVVKHLRRSDTAARTSVIVVSAHETFRAAAVKLAESLGISKVL